MWLIGREREYPFEMPDSRELSRWYLFSLGAFASATLLAMIVFSIGRLFSSRQMMRASASAFNALGTETAVIIGRLASFKI